MRQFHPTGLALGGSRNYDRMAAVSDITRQMQKLPIHLSHGHTVCSDAYNKWKKYAQTL